MSYSNILILGGGAAGLMAAITAARRGLDVTVLERQKGIGKKILVSGGGRCNFTNLKVAHVNFISANPDFCLEATQSAENWMREKEPVNPKPVSIPGTAGGIGMQELIISLLERRIPVSKDFCRIPDRPPREIP